MGSRHEVSILGLCAFAAVVLRPAGAAASPEAPDERTATTASDNSPLPRDAMPAGAPSEPARPPATSWSTISDAALAAEPEPARPPKAPPEHWYGWQTLLADAASLSVFALGDQIAMAGLLSWVAAPPVIHLLHGQGGRAAWSAGMRLAVPVFAEVMIAAANGTSSDDAQARLLLLGIIGVVVGAGGAIGVDAVNAYEPVERAPSALRLTPQLAISQRRTYLGLSGAF